MNYVDQKTIPSQKKGYTLVEMAVVLVIVGAALGAVFQGREMIENAHIKSVMQDFEKFTQAHYAYIKRTGHAAGLRRHPTTGNILFESFTAVRGYEYLESNYFADLIAEGFLLDKDQTSINTDVKQIVLLNSYGGDWLVSSNGHPFFPFDAPQLCTEGLPLRAVKAIDQKMDDGNPSTGRVRSVRYQWRPQVFYGAAWTNKIIPTLEDYTEENAPTIEYEYMACRLL